MRIFIPANVRICPGITIASRDLEQLCSISETVRVKSGAWDINNRIFVYTTLNHIKYCLANGDTGIIRTLDVPIYITRVQQQQLFCLDRECKTRVINVDTAEAAFKIALDDQNYQDVMRLVKHSRLCGKAIIAYLQSKGYPEVALHFVQDLGTRFKLALACGNIEIAMNTAYEMGDDVSWHRLGVEALRQGNHQVVEMAYQRTKNFERLSFLYLLTGNTEKLRKMLKIAEMRKDRMGQFHNALYLGDVAERVRVLEQSGQLLLAYLAAKTHGLDEADRLSDLLIHSGLQVPEVSKSASLLQPPTPILRAENWPLLNISKSSAYGTLNFDGDINENAESASPGGWDDLDLDADGNAVVAEADVDPGHEGWGDDLDLGEDTNAEELLLKEQTPSYGIALTVPVPGTSVEAAWCNGSSHAADHAAAGAFESSMNLLNRQISVSHFVPLKSHFLLIANSSSCCVPGLSLSNSLTTPLIRSAKETTTLLPNIPLTAPRLIEKLKIAYRWFQRGNFNAALACFEDIVVSIPFIVAESRSAANEVCAGPNLFQSWSQVRELLEISREYITAIRLKNANASSMGVRQMELSALFTHCKLQPAHVALALNLAMSQAFKAGNFINAAAFARRILELPDLQSTGRSDVHMKANVVLQKSEQRARNEHKLNYDERNPFDIDCQKFEPIYKGTQTTCCSFCGSIYSVGMRGSICLTCKISRVGIETLGLVTQSQSKR